jgi:hypothetical protein
MTPFDVAHDDDATLPDRSDAVIATVDVALAPHGDVDPVPIGDPDEDEGYGDEDDEDDDEDEDGDEDDEEPLQCARDRCRSRNSPDASGRTK